MSPISSGMLTTCGSDHDAKCDSVLKPGGWVQMVEWNLKIQSDNGRIDRLQSLRQWEGLYSRSLGQTEVPEGRKDRDIYSKLETLLRGAGFNPVLSETREVPVAPWSAGEQPMWAATALS